MSDDTELLWRYHLGRYYNGPPEQREEAFGFLMAQGTAIVPWLMGELLKKREGDQKAGQPGRDTLHLAALLAELGDPRSLMFLREVGDTALLGKLLRTMEARASAEDINALVGLLKAFGNSGLRAVFLTGFAGEITADEALSVAGLLVRMAERDPKPEFRAAIPHLRAGILFPNAPLEFGPLRKRLKAALVSHELPLPTTAPQSLENLPIPLEEHSTP